MSYEERYRVKEVARLSGVTVRTLHHYHRIGLLVPVARSEKGYRLYDRNDLIRLQQILIWRALGFPLAEIKRLLDEPGYDRARALQAQREALASRAAEFLAMTRAVDRSLAALEGGASMDTKQMFEGFDPSSYEDEVEERWGHTDAYEASKRRTARYSAKDWHQIKLEAEDIYERLARVMRDGLAPSSAEAAELAEAHRRHIDRWYYPCDPSRHLGLADLYTSDERFTAALDAHGEGLAHFLAEAIQARE